ncbi:LacI family transcriptional regulator [Microterricola gilva]|uniref:LacI family transcriptional regulator n=1 Tax=Microterricola gilva TaxID=393267 RepID=A0A4Q8APH5_9MICO|nr:LacI family DNA-binding transcriptional regulator [Microterricola gilva]RZU66592.1 LacI family transcriptional regulator [Microterricola gilva]
MVSIADVAEKAGVSQTTVSHALSGKRKVSDAVKRRVEDAMVALDYVPSRSAQNLALGMTRILAVLVPDIGNGFFAQLAKGAEAAAIARGYNILICGTGYDNAREVQYLQMIHSRAVDGVVYTAGEPPSEAELSRVLGGMPTVLVDEEIDGAELASVVSDNENGGRLAAEHLLALGHRSVLVMGVTGVIGRRRVQGFSDAWAEGGGEPLEIVWGTVTAESGRERIAPFVERIRNGELTSVFAGSDQMALGAMELLREHGLSVPRDVSVLGFDDSPDARFSSPSLSTVRQDILGLGGHAVTMLIDELEGLSEGTAHVVLPVELVARESTAPLAPARNEGWQ